jgi:hypothetical protein
LVVGMSVSLFWFILLVQPSWSLEDRRSIQLTVGVLGAVLFLVWLHRTTSTARAIGLPVAESPNWSVIFFFIPLANLVKPYEVMRQLTLVCKPNGVPRLLNVWFLTFLASDIGVLFPPFARALRDWRFGDQYGAWIRVPLMTLAYVSMVLLIEWIDRNLSDRVDDALAPKKRRKKRATRDRDLRALEGHE